MAFVPAPRGGAGVSLPVRLALVPGGPDLLVDDFFVMNVRSPGCGIEKTGTASASGAELQLEP